MKDDNLLTEKIEKTIVRYNMLAKGDRVLIAVSGGPDSIALLHNLNLLKDKFNIKIFVGHINHQLRKEESDQDQEFVKNLSEKLNLKFLCKSIDVQKAAQKNKLSIEECARKVRYIALESMAKKVKASKIAIGHTSDDQAETVLMRLIRGSGPSGLCGIPAIRGKFIRPLLDTKREEIESFLKENLLEYRIDWSNFKMDYLRNRIRLKLLALIKNEFNPNIVEILSRTAQLLSFQRDFLQKEIERSFEKASLSQRGDKIVLDLKRMIGYDIYLRTNIVRLTFCHISQDLNPPSFHRIQRVLELLADGKAGKKAELDRCIWAELSEGNLAIYKSKKPAKPHLVELPGEIQIENLKLKSEIIAREKLPLKIKSNSQHIAYLDWDKLAGPFGIRHRKDKDRFVPLGLEGSKTLADFLTDLKVPRMEREEIFLLTSKNRIAWVIGYRIDDRFKITLQTKKVLKIKAQKD